MQNVQAPWRNLQLYLSARQIFHLRSSSGPVWMEDHTACRTWKELINGELLSGGIDGASFRVPGARLLIDKCCQVEPWSYSADVCISRKRCDMCSCCTCGRPPCGWSHLACVFFLLYPLLWQNIFDCCLNLSLSFRRCPLLHDIWMSFLSVAKYFCKFFCGEHMYVLTTNLLLLTY